MPVHDGWTHCPHCGEALGYPTTLEDYCDHEFTIEGRYCFKCGYDPQIGNSNERKFYLAGGIALTVLALVAAFVSMAALAGDGILFLPKNGRQARLLTYIVAASAAAFVMGLGMTFRALRLDR